MTTTLSIRIDAETRRRLEALSKRTRRPNATLAAEAIAAFVEGEKWQHGEIQAGVKEVGGGRGVPHERVTAWLCS